MDGEIQAGDVVVSRVNGTLDLYIIATVSSAPRWDLTLNNVSTMHGRDAALLRGHQQRKDDQNVWLFGGSATAYVKAPTTGELMAAVAEGV
jgi:hypothetical protein